MFRVSFNRLILLLMLLICVFMIVLSLQYFSASNSAKFIYVDRNVEAHKDLEVNRQVVTGTIKRNHLQLGDLDKIKRIQAILGMPSDFVHVGGKHPEEQLVHIQDLINEYLGADVAADKTLNNIMQILFMNNSRKIDPPANNINKQLPVGAKVTQKMQEVAEVKVLSINELLERPPPNPPKIERVKPNDLPYIREENFKPSECPNSYTHKAEHSEWFRERYIPNVKMFLTKEDVNTFESYHKLSHYGLPFGFARENRTLLAELLNHPNYTVTSAYGTLSQKTCTRCAVVGCGGVLKGAGKGQEIDAHDHVFRVNRALTKGHLANDVGKRTSFYTFFPESDYTREIEDAQNAWYTYSMFKMFDVEYGKAMLSILRPPIMKTRTSYWQPPKPKVKLKQLRILHPDFMRYIFTHYLDSKAARPTTGALVVFLAMHLCDEVNIYGFGYDKRFTLHYYDTGFVRHSDAEMSAHDVDNERVLWRKLHSEGLITLFNRTTIN